MGTPEQQLELLAVQVRDLTAELTRQRDLVNTVQAQRMQDLEAMTRLQQTIITERESNKKRVQLVDVKGIGKPSVYNSDMKSWSSWSFKLQNFMEGVVSGIKEALDYVQDQEETLTQDNMDEIQEIFTTANEDADLKMIGRQLYTVLAQLMDGEALDLVQSTKDNDGFEAWRVVSRRFDPQGAGRRRNILGVLIQPGAVDAPQLNSHIAKWEERLRVYERRAGQPMQEDIKAQVLVSMTKGALKDHLTLNANKMKTYLSVREEIQSYLESKVNDMASPMDVGSLGQKDITCNNCGKKGHKKIDCWAPGGGAHKSSQHPKGSGKSSGKSGGKGDGKGGKGKSKGKEKFKDKPPPPYPSWPRPGGHPDKQQQQGFQGYCSLCWGWGHKRQDCPTSRGQQPQTRRGAHSLETNDKQEPETEQPGNIGGLDLCTLELNAVDDVTEEFFYAAVDSGAAESVVPNTWFTDVKTRPTVSSEMGTSYRAANGQLVQDEGEKILEVMTEDGSTRRLRCTSTGVHRMLLAVSKLVAKGHEVYFGPRECYLKHIASGRRLPIHLRRGVYTIKLKRVTGQERSAPDLSAVSGNSRPARQ